MAMNITSTSLSLSTTAISSTPTSNITLIIPYQNTSIILPVITNPPTALTIDTSTPPSPSYPISVLSVVTVVPFTPTSVAAGTSTGPLPVLSSSAASKRSEEKTMKLKVTLAVLFSFGFVSLSSLWE
jgi:hypothetical protein